MSDKEIEKQPGFWCWSQKGYPIFGHRVACLAATTLIAGCGGLVKGINSEGNSPKHATPTPINKTR